MFFFFFTIKKLKKKKKKTKNKMEKDISKKIKKKIRELIFFSIKIFFLLKNILQKYLKRGQICDSFPTNKQKTILCQTNLNAFFARSLILLHLQTLLHLQFDLGEPLDFLIAVPHITV